MTSTWQGGLAILVGLLVGRARLLGLTVPLAAAYYSAARSAFPRLAPAVCLALLAGGLTAGSYWQLGRMLLVLLAVNAGERWIERRKTRPRGHGGSVFGHAAFVVAAVAASYLPLALTGVLTRADLIVGTGEALAGALATAILHAGRQELGARRRLEALRGQAVLALALVVAAALTGLAGLTVAGLSVMGAAGALLTMVLARTGGGAVGALAGVVVGLVTGLSGQGDPAQIGAWAVAGMLGGIGGDYGKGGTVAGFGLGLLCLAGAVGRPAYLVAALWQSVAAGAALALLPSRALDRLRLTWRGPDAAQEGEQISSGVWLLAASRLTLLAHVFGELAVAFNHGSRPPADRAAEASGAGEAAAYREPFSGTVPLSAPERTAGSRPAGEARDDDRFLAVEGDLELIAAACRGACARFERCWRDRGVHTRRGLSSLLRRLARSRHPATVSPAVFLPWCEKGEVVLAAARQAVEQGRVVAGPATLFEVRRLLSRQLGGVAAITADLAGKMSLAEIPAAVLRAREIEDALVAAGSSVHRAVLTPAPSGFEVHVHATPCGGQWCAEHAAPAAGPVVGRRLALMSHQCELAGGGCCYVLITEPRFEMVVGRARSTKEAEVVSGDTWSSRPVGGHRHLLLLSDGMGSGPQAASESRTAAQLVEIMLEAGFPLETTMQTINAVLFLRSPGEAFATVDLALADLADGELDMVKIGACPSYLVRDGQVQVMHAGGLPLGIVDGISVGRLHTRLRQGDLLVMVSDGMLGCQAGPPRREDWLARLLERRDADGGPQDLADSLLEQAVTRQAFRDDDATVLVASLRRRGASS